MQIMPLKSNEKKVHMQELLIPLFMFFSSKYKVL